MFKGIFSKVGGFCKSVGAKAVKVFSVITVAVIGVAASATEGEATLPSTGVDVAGYITAGITAMGAIVAVAVGGYAAFLLIRKAFRWMGKAIG